MIHLPSFSLIEFISGNDPETLKEVDAKLRAQYGSRATELIGKYFPSAFLGTAFKKIPSKDAVEAIRDWYVRDETSRGLGLVGPTGLGKTRCAYRLIEWELRRPEIQTESCFGGSTTRLSFQSPAATVVNCGTEIALLVRRSTDFTDRTKATQWLTCLRDDDLVLLDDLGSGKLSESVSAVLYDIVDHRTANELPILFTTNHSGEELAARFSDLDLGAAVVRRLTEFCDIRMG